MRKIVTREENKTVLIDCCKEEKIYAICYEKTIYKLHKVDGWMFCSFASSCCGSSGRHDSMKKTIENQMLSLSAPINQFDNQKEFIEWCVEQLKSE